MTRLDEADVDLTNDGGSFAAFFLIFFLIVPRIPRPLSIWILLRGTRAFFRALDTLLTTYDVMKYN